MSFSINFRNILVVGVGLIGGSIIRALKESSFSGKVYGIDSDVGTLTTAHNLGYIQNQDTNIPKDLDNILVIFSVPVLSIQEAMSQIKTLINTKNVIYTDTLSVKSSVLKTLETRDNSFLNRFVLSHPIAGSEQSGFKASSPTLFKGKLSIICPHENNSKRDVSKVEDFWKAIGSYTKKLSVHDHDELFGKTSHMPHVIAYAIMDSLYQDLGDKAFLYSGGSLEDYTRIASSDPIMWKDIFISNNENILKSIEDFELSLNELKELIKQQDDEAIVKFLKDTKTLRDDALEND